MLGAVSSPPPCPPAEDKPVAASAPEFKKASNCRIASPRGSFRSSSCKFTNCRRLFSARPDLRLVARRWSRLSATAAGIPAGGTGVAAWPDCIRPGFRFPSFPCATPGPDRARRASRARYVHQTPAPTPRINRMQAANLSDGFMIRKSSPELPRVHGMPGLDAAHSGTNEAR